MAQRVDGLVDKIGLLLHGQGEEVQAAALADLFAMWLAGHVGPDADETNQRREELLTGWIALVRALVPVNEAIILERLKRESH
jgi:hypothetical protein